MNKKFYVLILTAILFAGSAIQVTAQQKIGHINSNELIMAMPERDSAVNQLEQKRQEFLMQSEELQVEFNKKYETYMTKRETLTQLIRQTKEAELNDMSKNIETFNTAADQELTRIQQELFQPIIERAQKAIKEVAEEQKFTYILDIGTGAVLHFPETGTENIMSAVKTKLGIK